LPPPHKLSFEGSLGQSIAGRFCARLNGHPTRISPARSCLYVVRHYLRVVLPAPTALGRVIAWFRSSELVRELGLWGCRPRRREDRNCAFGVAGVGTLTLLFTDLVGSTQSLVALGEDRFDAVRDEHDALVGGTIAAHHGELVKHTGDGYAHRPG